MFQYTQGYEVDGSSTSYNVVVAERQLIAEVLRYFLSLKIIDRQSELRYSETGAGEAVLEWDDSERLCEKVANTTARTINLSVNCIHPDQLFPQVRRDLYALTATRPGAEGKSYPYHQPTVSPFYHPALEVSFGVSFKDYTRGVKDYQPEGLVFNEQALVDQMVESHFIIDVSCGPGFIYEYAAYIMTKLAARFPEIGIDGGIDCAGGFVDGCTYASDLYAYERIRVGTGAIDALLQRLLDNQVITPTRPSGKYGRDLVPAAKLVLYHACNLEQARDEYLDAAAKVVKGVMGAKKDFSAAEYGVWVRKIASLAVLREHDFSEYCTCSVNFQESSAAITCIKENDEIVLEARVPSALREAFLKQIDLVGLK